MSLFNQVNLSSARSTMKNYGTENKKDSDPTTAKDRQVMARKSQKNRRLSMLFFIIRHGKLLINYT